MVTSDAHEALFGCNHLGCIAMLPIPSCIPFPFSTSCDDMLTMLICPTCWLYMHLYTLVYMFMHESCLLVCHLCFNTIEPWTFNPNLNLSLADTTFCLFSRLCAPFCLFVCYLACLLSHMFSCILVAMLAISILLVCFTSFCYYLRIVLLLLVC